MSDIFGVRVTPQLDTLNSIVISNIADGQVDPAVCFSYGNYFTAWYNQFGDRTINATRITPEGVVLNLGNYIGDGGEGPDIACDNENCLVVWSREYYGVCARFIDSLAQAQGHEMTIAITQATSTVPQLAFGSVDYLVVWPDFCESGTDLDIFGQLITTNGILLGDRITIAHGPEIQRSVSIAFDGNNYLIIWLEGPDGHNVFGQFVTTDGLLLDNKFLISDDTLYWRQDLSLECGADNYLVVWAAYHDGLDTYGNLDISVGIEETKPQKPISVSHIISGPLCLPDIGEFKIYDILGRQVEENQMRPGVYFLKIGNRAMQKVVKVR
jgi:hypothetical protein